MSAKSKQPLKVGFDLDGVLLYNPARIARPLIKLFKQYVLRKNKVSFYVPNSPLKNFLWDMLHKSSICIAPGVNDIYRLVDEGKIEAYIITGRFEHLKKDTDKWIKKLNHKGHFKKFYFNQKADQPHLYKQALIQKHKLDIFIDDNLDIAQHLHHKLNPSTRTYWVSNILDQFSHYPYKYPSLRKAVQKIISETQ